MSFATFFCVSILLPIVVHGGYNRDIPLFCEPFFSTFNENGTPNTEVVKCSTGGFSKYFPALNEIRNSDVATITYRNSRMGEKLPLDYLYERYLNLESLSYINSVLRKIEVIKFKKLRTLNLFMNKIDFIDESAFEGCPNLENIDLSYNRIENSEILSSNTFNGNQYRSLNLSHNLLNEKFQFINFPKSSKSDFQMLDLSYNKIVKINAKHIKVFSLNVSSNAIKSLKIENFIGNEINAENNVIEEISINNPDNSLEVLNLNSNQLKNNFGSICGLKSLKKLFLNSNEISKINQCFSKMQNLTTITLKRNQLSRLSWNSFHPDNQIEVLDLSHNNIKVFDEYTMSIFKNLKYFYINNNRISDITLSPWLYMPKLVEINLTENIVPCSKLLILIRMAEQENIRMIKDEKFKENAKLANGIVCNEEYVESNWLKDEFSDVFDDYVKVVENNEILPLILKNIDKLQYEMKEEIFENRRKLNELTEMIKILHKAMAACGI